MKTVMILLITLLWAVAAQASWLSEMIDDAIGAYSSGLYVESQKFGYASAGTVNYRIPLKRDPLISVAPPSYEIGCGGINLFMGGIAFMNADYLVQKLKRSLQAAPYVAFDLGLKALCSDCSEVIKTVEQIANMLNSMDFDECALAKGMVTTIAEAGSGTSIGNTASVTAIKNMASNAASGVGSHFSNLGKKDGDIKDRLQAELAKQPDSFQKTWLKEGGSLLKHIADWFNDTSGGNNATIAKSISTARAYFGDIIYDKNKFDFIMIPPCAGVKSSMDEIINSVVYKNTNTDKSLCTDDGEIPFVIATTALNDIAIKIKDNQALTDDTYKFIGQVTIPVVTLLGNAYAVDDKYGDTIRINLAPITAGSYVYSPLATLGAAMLTALDEVRQSEGIYTDSDLKVNGYRLKVNDKMNTVRGYFNDQITTYNAIWNIIIDTSQGDKSVAKE